MTNRDAFWATISAIAVAALLGFLAGYAAG